MKNRERVKAGVIVGVVLAIMIIPLPTIVLDALMAMNLILSLLILLIVLKTRRAADFSLLPTVFLILMVCGLVLKIPSTGLILTKGAAIDSRMVRLFSFFVAGSDGTAGLVAGIGIFIAVTIVQVLVITRGAVRVTEVAARFILDLLPVKQMAIEAEYNSGAITREESNAKKESLQKEADFYGEMAGTVLHGEAIDESLGIYIPLAIGDGLIFQFQALLLSTSVGIIVTRLVPQDIPS